MNEGRVKWFREDGTGYISYDKKPDRTVLVHYSAIKSDHDHKSLHKGQKVKFRAKTILGREVAIYVEPI